MTLTTTDTSLITTLLALIERKKKHNEEGKQIEKLYHIYRKELQELEKQMHATAGGQIMLIEQMTDDHLFNTVTLISDRKGFDCIPEKYMTELKKRPQVMERVLKTDDTVNDLEAPDDDWF